MKHWEHKLEAIGWEFDFQAWTVQPKERGLAKLLIMLFEVVPVGSEWIRERDMEKLQGLVQWYAAGIPAGAAFISSLYACPRTRNDKGKNRMKLTRAAQRDLMWWRALVFFRLPPKARSRSQHRRREKDEDPLLVHDDGCSENDRRRGDVIIKARW